MRKINKKKAALLVLKIVSIVIILSVVSFFAFRNMILEKAINSVAEKMDTDYDSYFTVKEASFKGLSGIEMNEISIKPKQADTLLHVEHLKTSINLSLLLAGDIQLGSMEMKNGYIQLIKNKQGKNFQLVKYSLATTGYARPYTCYTTCRGNKV